MSDLAPPKSCASVLTGLKYYVHQARYRAQRIVNTELIRLNWQIDAALAEHTEQAAVGR